MTLLRKQQKVAAREGISLNSNFVPSDRGKSTKIQNDGSSTRILRIVSSMEKNRQSKYSEVKTGLLSTPQEECFDNQLLIR